ncbi:MAG TPA: thiolase family protein [Burkholderiaceae bacterium]|nr:thiolase family protein [Burkholderiaceae bacterium]
MARKALSAILGTGVSALVRKYDLRADMYAAQAIDRAIQDAGLDPREIDGLLINRSPVARDTEFTLAMQSRMGYRRLGLCAEVDGEGSSAIQMIHYASMAIRSGLASKVVCVFADTPLKPNMTGADAFGMPLPILDLDGWERTTGLYGPVGTFALFASFHMAKYGITPEQLGSVAVSDRQWALLNPQARLRTPLTLEGYLRSPYIASPLRMLDCAYPVNGAAAIVVGAAASVGDAGSRVAFVHGMGQGHSLDQFDDASDEPSGAQMAARGAYRMAAVTPAEIDQRQFYEAFSYANLYALEEYGFCRRGESGALAAAGALAPGGALPTNTGGGQLSCYYLQGMTPIVEAVTQVRGLAGARQRKADLVLATGFGSFFQHHACVVLSPHRTLN